MGNMLGGGSSEAVSDVETSKAVDSSAVDSPAAGEFSTNPQMSSISTNANSMMDRPEFSDLKSSGIQQSIDPYDNKKTDSGGFGKTYKAISNYGKGGGSPMQQPMTPEIAQPDDISVDALPNQSPQFSSLMEYLRGIK